MPAAPWARWENAEVRPLVECDQRLGRLKPMKRGVAVEPEAASALWCVERVPTMSR